MSYDNWKSTDPADADPYRSTDCPECGSPEGYECAPECECPACVKAMDALEDPRDEAYERAAARARLNDFARSLGKDWT